MNQCPACGAQAPEGEGCCAACGAKLPGAAQAGAPRAGEVSPYCDRLLRAERPGPSAPPPYRVPAPQPPAPADPSLAPVSVGTWLGVLVLLAIPLVNVILIIVWASCAERRSLRNFARALVICLLVLLIFMVITGILLAREGLSLADVFLRWLAG